MESNETGSLNHMGDAPQHAAPVSPVPGKAVSKPVNIAFFYPEGHEKDFESVKRQFREVIAKNKFVFRLEAVFERGYVHNKRINSQLFAELCKTNRVDIAIILAPPSYTAGDGSVFDMMPEVFEANNVAVEIIPYGDLMKQYRYLNILLDITLLIH